MLPSSTQSRKVPPGGGNDWEKFQINLFQMLLCILKESKE
jgi:hypothetical protein